MNLDELVHLCDGRLGLDVNGDEGELCHARHNAVRPETEDERLPDESIMGVFVNFTLLHRVKEII
jgi:hypothetical protein